MIARLWSARANESHCLDYLQHFEHSVVPELRKRSGYVGSTVLARTTGIETEILVTTIWRSLDAIREFAGPDLETGLSDVADRVGALGGKLCVERIPGDATTMRVEIPCGS